ncbi:hypothetical protein EXS65_03620 [Candidatus Peribacteria bacterium]|nr:hypothetical protein [Candidatus Peribacteria bacterium]
MWIPIIAMMFYALEIAITDMKLSALPPRLTTLYYSSGVAFFALISLLVSREEITAPNSSVSVFVGLMILSSFIAANAHFESISQGIGTARLTLVYAFLPVAGALYSAMFKRELPSLNLIAACALAGLALYLVSTTQKPLPLK